MNLNCSWILLGLLCACTQRGDVLTRRDVGDARVPSLGTDIAVGDRHACATTANGLYCWGENEVGQLGSGDDANQLLPHQVLANRQFREVRAGKVHSCALDDLGRVYCWGGNERGQLGLGDRDLRRIPTEVALPERSTSVTTKFHHTCSLLVSGKLACWGQNWEGQMGQADLPPTADQTAADALLPVLVGTELWRLVAAGDGHTCAIRLDGSLWCWGRNSEHELGAETRIQVREPLQVTSDGPWMDVSAGQNHTCAIRGDQTLWCWGQNTGQGSGSGAPLGIVDAVELPEPTRVGGNTTFIAIRGHTFHGCAIRSNMELWCWGRNAEGQLGTGDIDNRETPALVQSGIAAVSAGPFASCAVTSDGSTLCTGKNEAGQLGTGDLDRRREFTSVLLVSTPSP